MAGGGDGRRRHPRRVPVHSENESWHELWSGDGGDNIVYWLGTVTFGTTHYLYWTTNAGLYRVEIPHGVYNPLTYTGWKYAEFGELWTPVNTMGYEEIQKVAIRLKVRARMPTGSALGIWYRLDEDEGVWTVLGTLDDTNDNEQVELEFADGVGLPFYSIQFKYTMGRSATNTTSPALLTAVLEFKFAPDKRYSYSMLVDLTRSEDGYTLQEMREYLQQLNERKTGIDFTFRTQDETVGTLATKKVEVSSFTLLTAAGPDGAGRARISLVER